VGTIHAAVMPDWDPVAEPDLPLLIYHRLAATSDTAILTALQESDASHMVVAKAPDPSLEDPWQALTVLRNPVDRVCALYEDLSDTERAEWSLSDVYLELGGGGPRTSEAHEQFADFFNGQARAVLSHWRDPWKLEYWAGIPERGTVIRDSALELLEERYVVGVAEQPERSLERFTAALARKLSPHLGSRPGEHRGRPDPRTRSLILAHNQIDAELHANFQAAVERDRLRPRPRTPRAPQRSGAICVLGAPRSGTSLTTRILNVLGVELGPEAGLMPAAAANNRTGFWEHEDIANLNEDIFATLSDPPPPYLQGWRWPPRLQPGWEQDPRLDPHRRAARSILRRDFAGRALWGWKDPRCSLTLPFWQQLVAEMRYVICVRHPLDVAASLAVRDRMPIDESVRLWLRYMSEAVESTDGGQRIFVHYEDFFDDWASESTRLATFLGLREPSDAQREAIADHLDERMWHHRREEEEAEANLPLAVSELYATVRAQA
jgi:sulfotransferase family protein